MRGLEALRFSLCWRWQGFKWWT